MNATHLEGQQSSSQIKQYYNCLLYVTASQHRYKQLNVSSETDAVSQRTQRPRHSPVADIAAQLLQSSMKLCACRRRLAGAWPRASCIIVAIETWRITRKDTGCVNTLLISYGICRQVCDWSKWWSRISVGWDHYSTHAGDTGVVDVDNSATFQRRTTAQCRRPSTDTVGYFGPHHTRSAHSPTNTAYCRFCSVTVLKF